MIQSWLDVLTYEGLRGWAVDSAAPNYRVPIKCIFNGKLSEIAISDQSRPDLIGPTAAGDAFHGFSARTPIWSWGQGSTLDLIAVDSAGKDVLIARKPVPSYLGLQTISNGLLTAWFSLNEGGTLVGLRSAEFPHADNLVDNGQPYGRAIQMDIYYDGMIPTEGGAEIPVPAGSPVVNWKNANGNFTCITKIREWTTGAVTEWSLVRTTRIEGRTVVSKFLLLNGHPATKKVMISYDWYFDPNLVNRYVEDPGDKVWECDTNFLIKSGRIATIYDQWEGQDGLAISFACSPKTDKFFSVDDTFHDAWPRCVFSGWRVFDVEMPPQGNYSGWQFTTVAPSVATAKQTCADAMARNGVA